eukprot:TRINITY_DN3335_c0_g2_i3.p1 TRINITY_DN3335_c0_g2~~TRINITY_DN3335_c0_g2_i3.p1  ORF type:complete len:539 (+),score=26.60 TRINITY_DN3335_c0_g2_i3:169-1785(+)
MIRNTQHVLARRHSVRREGVILVCTHGPRSRFDLPSRQTFCTHIARKISLGLEFLQEHAESLGGRCLAREYINCAAKVLWECQYGHTWEAFTNNVIYGKTWCPHCARKPQMSLNRLQAHAEKSGGRCLATEDSKCKDKVLWQCSRGHTWEATVNNVINGNSWCPHCAGKARVGLERLQKHAESLGGRCLAVEYRNTNTTVLWECKHGHKWETRPRNVLYAKRWCPRCAGNDPLKLRRLQEHARNLGGRCLASAYSNSKMKIRWECKHGHVWEATANGILNKSSWCPSCAWNSPAGLKPLQQHAETLGGRCLAMEYRNRREKVLWECNYGHRWEASSDSVINQKSWCPSCARKAKVSLQRLRGHAESLGGTCLATEFQNSYSKVYWECRHGHRWYATINNVLHGKTWCPHCTSDRWKNERDVRQVLEGIFHPHTFPTCKPLFLGGLQLDGFSATLQLGFEYQGEQHYDPQHYFHRNRPLSFEKSLERDARKVRLCNDEAVRLLVIPYFVKDRNAFVRLGLLQWFTVSEVNPLQLPASWV